MELMEIYSGANGGLVRLMEFESEENGDSVVFM